jgi:mono/diheme cytochrome c family protein
MKIITLAVCVAFPFVIACGASSPPPTPNAPVGGATGPGGAPLATFADQVAAGQKLYGENCATCHGASGEGKKAPAVVGLKTGALPLDPPAGAKFRKTQFKTVADIANFVVKSMPPDSAGTLSGEEYWAILAFDLKANGVDLGDKKLDGALASGLTVPR